MKHKFAYFYKVFITLALAAIFVAAPLGALAEVITYTGDASERKQYPDPIYPLSIDSFYTGDGLADSSGNTVIINYVPGAGMTDLRSAMGGVAWNGIATGNTLIMHNGVVETASGGVGGNGGGSATHNTVIINGGKVTHTINGGYSVNGHATHNTVTIGAGADLAGAYILGGYVGSPALDGFSGNTLNINGYTTGAGTIGELYSFEYLNFSLPANVQNNSTILRVGTVNLGESSPAGSVSQITVNIMDGGRIQQVGEVYTLITATTWTGSPIAQNGQSIFGTKGLSLLYEFEIAQNSNAVTASVKSVRSNPQSKSFLQARNAALVTLNRGGDLSSGYGMDSAKASAKKGLRSFFALNGSSVEQETGSGIDLDGASLMAGAAWGRKIRASEVTVGVFAEAGMGSYDSHNSFNDLPSIDANGDTHYLGGGILASFEAISGFEPARGFHADASLRGGYVESDYSSSAPNLVQQAEFNTKGYYLGAHLSAGYAFKITKKSTLDAYGKYLFAHIASDDATVLGDSFKFDSASSQRVRGGLRYAHSFGAVKPYLGAAYEYELDGEAGGSVLGHALENTDMGGGTVIGELGFAYSPTKNFSVSLAAEGYGGKRDGFGGNFSLRYKF